MLATTTPAQDKAIATAKEKLTQMGPAVRNAANPLFKIISNLDAQLEAAIRRLAEAESQLEAKKDSP
jgi:hypothetical protein